MPPSGSEWIDLGGGIEAEVALETSSAWHVRALHQGGVALTWQHAIEELEAGRLGVQLSALISRSPPAACESALQYVRAYTNPLASPALHGAHAHTRCL